jgi:hypothetical protein
MQELHAAALESLASLKSQNSLKELVALAGLIINRKS